MGRKFTVYGLRFSKTSFWNRINTGFLDPAVATVLTACGIETIKKYIPYIKTLYIQLQQCLPLAVLKPTEGFSGSGNTIPSVATVLTACGIETTLNLILIFYYKHEVATVLTACGIETYDKAILI